MSQSNRKNCWEVKNCGREPGGENVSELGVCPAAIEDNCDGVNGGSKGGRICWALAGTLCGGKVQGMFAMKIESCVKCEFFQQVVEEEGHSFSMYPENEKFHVDQESSKDNDYVDASDHTNDLKKAKTS